VQLEGLPENLVHCFMSQRQLDFDVVLFCPVGEHLACLSSHMVLGQYRVGAVGQLLVADGKLL
jgi:hypothetical protein